MASDINLQNFSLPHDLSEVVKTTLDDWEATGKDNRLWARDPSVWTNSGEDKWLGWLDIVAEQLRNVRRFTNFAAEVNDAKFSHVLLMGMGGSSLCPEVMRESFGKLPGFPELHILDSTNPLQIKTIENKIDLAKTLFIVSSKSATTLKPNMFKYNFFQRVRPMFGQHELRKCTV